MATYKLRCSLLGHSKDVRAVATTPQGDVITGSRDNSARLWGPMEDGLNYEQKQVYTGHSGYVTSVCYVPGTAAHRDGLVATGSRDSTILIHPVSGGQPVYTLTGHSDTVSSLMWFGGVLISGSWDHSARVWKDWECVQELKGHEGPLWDVVGLPKPNAQPDQPPAFILTASADKLVKMWADGKVTRTFTGHKDCVRGLTVLGSERFLSCSNDASVILWAVNGDCLATYYGHTNFIYTMNAIGGEGSFVTGGEDRTLRVWSPAGDCSQTIHIPAQSVWAVGCLPNTDIVCGSSDGTCRIFSKTVERQADAADLKAFEESLAKSTMAVGDLGGVKKSELPGREALFAPGKRDGHTIMVREGEKVNCYSWSAASQEWTAVGEVVGGAGGSQGTSGKVLFEGKEYDYVFDVELDEGNRLKLPYNVSEDPYFAAQRFIHRHELPQEFLDQVANFVITNTKGMTLGVEGGGSYTDPFTGGSRYVPGGSSGATGGTDPFTGSGRYVPGSAGPSNIATTGTADPFTGSSSYTTQGSAPPTSHFFPQITPLRFEACNPNGILTKLTESNGKVASEAQLVEDLLTGLVTAVTGDNDMNPQLLAPLEKALQWPAEHVWPALDVLRLALRSNELQKVWLDGDRGDALVSLLVSLIRPPSPVPARLLSLRCLANMAAHETGRCVLAKSMAQVASATVEISPYPNKNMEIAAATVLLNYSVILGSLGSLEDQCQVLSGASATAMCVKDPEAQFRALVALGTLLHQSAKCRSLAVSLDIKPIVQSLSTITDPAKVGECAGHVLRLI